MTTSSAMRPRSPSEIVDAAFQIMRAHYTKFVMCAAIAYVPMLLFRLLFMSDLNSLFTSDASSPSRSITMYVVIGLASVGAYGLMGAVIVTCTAQAYTGEPVDIGVAVRRVVKKLPLLIAATVLVYLWLVLGLIFFLFPAMYVAARNFAVVPAIILEDTGIGGAFVRSKELSSGRKWHILNTLGLAFLIYFVIWVGVLILTTWLGGLIVRTVAATLVSICVYPVVAVTNVLLYYDARIQREGLDIELMAGALPSTDAPAAT